MTEARFPRSVFGTGGEPDARFSLANERTFLAWHRTALALIAGGVALESLGANLQPAYRLAAALVLIVTGTLTPGLAWLDWMRIERAIREGRALPGAKMGLVLTGGVTVSGLLVVLAVLFA